MACDGFSRCNSRTNNSNSVSGDGEVELLDGFDRNVGGREVEHLRVAHVALAQPLHRRGDGGAEQQRLPRLRAAAEDLFDVGAEADIEHPVGFVEDHHANVAQHQRAASQMVENSARECRPPRRRRGQGPGFACGAACRHRWPRCGRCGPPASLTHLVANLDGQLPRRHQDHGLRIGFLRPFPGVPGSGCKRGRLAGSGPRLAHHVHAQQGPRDQTGLNRGGLGIAGRIEGLQA